MAAATLAFASWWTTNTVFDSTRTTRIASVVLSSEPLRAHVAEAIARDGAIRAVDGLRTAPNHGDRGAERREKSEEFDGDSARADDHNGGAVQG